MEQNGSTSSPQGRSRGITIFAWLVIAGSLLGLLGAGGADSLNPRFSNYLYVVICSVSIAIGIFLLKLKEAARIAIIVISALVIAETLITMPYAINMMRKNIAQQIEISLPEIRKRIEETSKDPKMAELAKKDAEELEGIIVASARSGAVVILVVMVLLSLGFNAGAIYFFTRSQVKQQFAGAESESESVEG